ncbi:PE-PGRS family protein [Streptomyces sp. NPDC102395]|uniref:PE-PGRS family protein n=1 Tax=Streptomyces sp. NPDC102395 TaxID=3366168 RepID=UPI0037FD3403
MTTGVELRNVNPNDLDMLAKLLDGKGGTSEKLSEAFLRASQLGVSDKLSAIKPMQTWVAEAPPDLRKRAGTVREEQLFERGDRETYSDWLMRIEAHYLAKVPGFEDIGEQRINEFLSDVSDVVGVSKVGGVTLVASMALANNIFQNSWYNGLLRQGIQSPWWASGGTARAGASAVLQRIPAGELRSLSAPGSWLPGRLGNLFARSSIYQNVSRIPFTATTRATLLGRAWDGFRSLPVINSPAVNRGINFLVGSDALASRYGGVTHSGALVSRAGQANLIRVFRSASYFQELNNARPAVIAAGRTASPFLKGLGTAAKAGGFLRVAGAGASLVSTGVSVANVWAQGNPRDAFKKKGAGYVADVAEVGFNASLTAAMVAPNPVTVGLAVGTGLVYGGAKVVEHWPEIKTGAGKAVEKVEEVGEDIASGAKSVAKAANPMSWF